MNVKKFRSRRVFASSPWFLRAHWGFACCRLVRERSWLMVCSLGRLFMRLCKCVRHQRGESQTPPVALIGSARAEEGLDSFGTKDFIRLILRSPSYCSPLSIPSLPPWSRTKSAARNGLARRGELVQKRDSGVFNQTHIVCRPLQSSTCQLRRCEQVSVPMLAMLRHRAVAAVDS